MLLEKQLLNNRDAGLGPRPAKRARGASAPLPEGTTAWVELARYTHLEISSNISHASHMICVILKKRNEGCAGMRLHTYYH